MKQLKNKEEIYKLSLEVLKQSGHKELQVLKSPMQNMMTK